MDSNNNTEEQKPADGEQKSAEAQDTQSSEEQKVQEEGVEVSPVEMPPLEDSSGGGQKSDEAVNLQMILDLPVDIRAELGHTQMSIREVLKLGQGAVVQLDRSAGSSADIVVNGKLIGQGDVVVVDENFGVRITRLITPEERIETL